MSHVPMNADALATILKYCWMEDNIPARPVFYNEITGEEEYRDISNFELKGVLERVTCIELNQEVDWTLDLVKELTSVLHTYKNITSLQVSYGGDENITRELFKAIGGSSLTFIHFRYFHISVAAAEILAEKLQNLEVESLNLSHCGLTDESFEPIVRVLPLLRLQRFELFGNVIGQRGAEDLALALECENCRRYLEVLNISDNQMGKGVRAIVLALRDTNVREFFGSRSYKQTEDPLGLFDVLQLRNVETLDLSDVQGTDQLASSFGALLQNNRNLKFLDLSGNRFTRRGISNLSEGLPRNAHLRSLNLTSDDQPTFQEIVPDLMRNTRLHVSMRHIAFATRWEPEERAALRRLVQHLENLHSPNADVFTTLCTPLTLRHRGGQTLISLLSVDIIRLVAIALVGPGVAPAGSQ